MLLWVRDIRAVEKIVAAATGIARLRENDVLVSVSQFLMMNSDPRERETGLEMLRKLMATVDPGSYDYALHVIHRRDAQMPYELLRLGAVSDRPAMATVLLEFLVKKELTSSFRQVVRSCLKHQDESVRRLASSVLQEDNENKQ